MKSSQMEIGELAGRFGLGTHVLRHWEAQGLLTPARRVSGRRRYGEEHLVRVAMILRAKDAGFSLERIRSVLTEVDSTERRTLLEHHQAELVAKMERLRESLRMVEHALACDHADIIQCPRLRAMVLESIPPAP
ncbi:MerR family transcriptional regulator [Allokutzneria oryzae]|uniref:MerR family transcriptional regulator n=1 Tax=Allokutzneria oryzae TaxID=1378989 RepID=A0ABV5ZNW1_9PSEU